MQKKHRRGQHATLGDTNVHRHVFGAETVDNDFAEKTAYILGKRVNSSRKMENLHGTYHATFYQRPSLCPD